VQHCRQPRPRGFKHRCRKDTLVLKDDVARWAANEAAARDTSVARLLAQILEERMRDSGGYAAAMERSLHRRPVERREAGSYPARDERHERD
jgi:hypothetical protein